MKILLRILPYLGLILSAASALWGLTHELFTKDPQNKRHLTKAGKYSIAFTLAGLFLSLNTSILKDITEKQDKAEAREQAAIQDRQRTLAEIQRTNSILWNIRRTQYPLSRDIRMNPLVRISVEHPDLKPYAEQIESEADHLFKEHRVSGDSESVFDLVPVSKDSYLFSRPEGMPNILRSLQLYVSIYKQGSNFSEPKTPPDLRFTYAADIFRGETEGNTTYRGTMSYSVNSRRYRVSAPSVSAGFKMLSTGTITSILDLAGATLMIDCDDQGKNSGCSHFSFESLRLQVSSGIELEIRGSSFEHLTINGRDVVVHKFDPDGDKFIEKYSYYARN